MIRAEQIFNWTEVEPYLDCAIDLDSQQREIWLSSLEITQPGIARVVRSLLEQRDALNAAGFMQASPRINVTELKPLLHNMLAKLVLQEPALSSAVTCFDAESLAAGASVGPYRLLRQIGHGGMSQVWLAEPGVGQLQRPVALKLPFIGLHMQVERFVRERDMLAALTHPQIARLYAAGISDAGQPYLAMEYVEGTALLESCDARRLTVRERLRLFLQVLEAVQFAHGQLIIHRDLKPSNILVTPQGRAVLLDFGIGKLLVDGTAHATQLTQMAGRALTPDYASPEQIAGQPLGTASDIYSLGIILYELLTGARPYRLKRDSLGALEDAILGDDLRRPSQSGITAVAAVARGSSVRALCRSMAGDLDTIVLKALKKVPHERYTSVTAFAHDIGSYLQNLPISARPDSGWYRAGRFVSRHALPVAAASVALCAVLSGASLALWQARVAADERDHAAAERDRAVALAARNEAVGDFLDVIMTEVADANRPVTAAELMQHAERYALGNTRDLPENRATILEMLAAVQIANPAHAKQLLDAGLDMLAPSPDEALKSGLRCFRGYVVGRLGDVESGIAQMKAELPHLQADPMVASECLASLASLCSYGCVAGDALRYAQAALARTREIRNPTYRVLVQEAQLLGSVAFAYTVEGDNRRADSYFTQALAKYQQTGRQDSRAATDLKNDWGVTMADAGQPKRALQLYDEVLKLEAQRNPDSPPSMATLYGKARVLAAIGRFEAAREAFGLACRLNDQENDRRTFVSCRLSMASLAAQTGQLGSVAELLARVEPMVAAEYANDKVIATNIAILKGRYELARGHFEAARQHFANVIHRSRSRLPTSRVAMAQLDAAEVELATGHAAQAAKLARDALATSYARLANFPYSERVGLASLMLGRALEQQGNPIAAREALSEAVAHLSSTVDADHPALLQASHSLGSLQR